MDEEDIDDEDMLIGKLLSKYINDKIERDESKKEEEDESKYDDILRKYDRQMRHFFMV